MRVVPPLVLSATAQCVRIRYYSRTSIIRPSIIRNLDYPEPRLSGLAVFLLSDQKMGVSLKRACALQLLPWRHACLSSAHAQRTMWHCCLSMKWVDQGVVYHSIIRHIHLSGLLLEPRCPDNRGSTVY